MIRHGWPQKHYTMCSRITTIPKTIDSKIYNLYYIEIKDKMHKNKNYNPELMNTMQKL